MVGEEFGDCGVFFVCGVGEDTGFACAVLGEVVLCSGDVFV